MFAHGPPIIGRQESYEPHQTTRNLESFLEHQNRAEPTTTLGFLFGSDSGTYLIHLLLYMIKEYFIRVFKVEILQHEKRRSFLRIRPSCVFRDELCGKASLWPYLHVLCTGDDDVVKAEPIFGYLFSQMLVY